MTLAVGLSACGPNPPVMSLEDRACTSAPALQPARAVTLDSKRLSMVSMRQDFACIEEAGGSKSSYVAFRLPSRDGPATITAASDSRLFKTLLPPRLWLLDGNGAVVRRFGLDEFTRTQAGAFRLARRLLPDEAYAVVLSEPKLVGGKTTMVVDGRSEDQGRPYQVAALIIIPVYRPPRQPVPREVSYVFNGYVGVQVSSVDYLK